MSAVALAYGLVGDDRSYRLWQARAVEVAGVEAADRYRHLTFAAFVDARVATHTGNMTQAQAIVDKAFRDLPRGWYETYARASAAELAIVAGLPEAEQHLADATPPPKKTTGPPPAWPAPPADSTTTRKRSPDRSRDGNASVPDSNAPLP
jgi:hypothetical protein